MVFRDRGGRVGVLHLHCAHRGTSLEFGIPVERGIRCCYHGWVYDVDGRCLGMPGEPPGSRLSERVCQGAYPTHEFTGTDLRVPGAAGSASGLSDVGQLRGAGPSGSCRPAKFTLPCNWLQVKDNSMDPVHTAFLHALSSGYQFTEAFGVVPELDWGSRDRGRHGLHRDAPGGRAGVGARVRLHAAQRAPVHARDRGSDRGQACQPAGRHPVGRAQRRPADHQLRAGPGRSGLAAHARAGGAARLRAVQATGRMPSASAFRPTSTRSRASAPSRYTTSSTWPRPTAA